MLLKGEQSLAPKPSFDLFFGPKVVGTKFKEALQERSAGQLIIVFLGELASEKKRFGQGRAACEGRGCELSRSAKVAGVAGMSRSREKAPGLAGCVASSLEFF